MVEKMCKKNKFYSLLVDMQTNIVIVEFSLENSIKIKIKTTI